MSLWDSVRDSIQKTAEKAGNVAMISAQKTKLNAETLLVDREITQRKHLFGVTLYDHVAPLSSTPEFYASNDKQTDTLRPFLLTAQREIAALENRKTKIREQQAQAEVTRKSAFPVPAQTIGGKVMNAGKSATLAAGEAKLMTDKAAVETLIRGHKQDFGEALFDKLVELEDKEGWLPSDRDIRAMYDQTRRDVEKLLEKRAAKEQELAALDDPNAAADAAAAASVYSTPTVPQMTSTQGSSSTSSGRAASNFVSSASATAAAAVSNVAGTYGSTQTAVAAKMASASMSNNSFSFGKTAAPVPAAPAVPSYSQQHHQTAAIDPFPSTTNYATSSARAPAPAAPDLFASSSSSGTGDLFANTSGYVASSAPANSFGSSSATDTAAAAAATNSSYDPFANVGSITATPAPANRSFAPTASPTDPFAGLSTGTSTAPPPASADPFAGTIFAGTTSQQQTQGSGTRGSNNAPHYYNSR